MARSRKSALIFLDTHVICWLFAGKTALLSAKAIEAIEQHELYVSPIVDLELEYLYEIDRISMPANQVLSALQQDIGLQIAPGSFKDIMQSAKTLTWARDPFDRLIVGHAMLENASLVTRDSTIQEYFEHAIW